MIERCAPLLGPEFGNQPFSVLPLGPLTPRLHGLRMLDSLAIKPLPLCALELDPRTLRLPKLVPHSLDARSLLLSRRGLTFDPCLLCPLRPLAPGLVLLRPLAFRPLTLDPRLLRTLMLGPLTLRLLTCGLLTFRPLTLGAHLIGLLTLAPCITPTLVIIMVSTVRGLPS